MYLNTTVKIPEIKGFEKRKSPNRIYGTIDTADLHTYQCEVYACIHFPG